MTGDAEWTSAGNAADERDVDSEGDIRSLRERLYHFHIAIEQSPVATAITDINGRIEFINQRFSEVTGYTREELIGNTPAMIQSGMTPASVYRDMWQTLMAGRVWKGELLNRRKNGELYWDNMVITPVRDGNDRIVNFIAVKQDVTEKKRRDNELRLLATAFETGQATLITDAEMRIEKVNKAFTDITGYASEEVIGLTPKLFKSGVHDKAFYSSLWDALLSRGHWQGEIWNRNKYDDIYPLWQSITAVHDHQGEIRNFVAVFHNISERKRTEEELERRAMLDHLTGACNRRAFDENLRDAIHQAERVAAAFSLLIFDIDHFKAINDRHGHEAGDRVLKELSDLVSGSLRNSDILSRWGGEEFTILLPHTGRQGAIQFAERLRRRIADARFHELSITISVGLVEYRQGDDGDAMISRADSALYQAKHSGRNRVVACMGEMEYIEDGADASNS